MCNWFGIGEAPCPPFSATAYCCRYHGVCQSRDKDGWHVLQAIGSKFMQWVVQRCESDCERSGEAVQLSCRCSSGHMFDVLVCISCVRRGRPRVCVVALCEAFTRVGANCVRLVTSEERLQTLVWLTRAPLARHMLRRAPRGDALVAIEACRLEVRAQLDTLMVVEVLCKKTEGAKANWSLGDASECKRVTSGGVLTELDDEMQTTAATMQAGMDALSFSGAAFTEVSLGAVHTKTEVAGVPQQSGVRKAA